STLLRRCKEIGHGMLLFMQVDLISRICQEARLSYHLIAFRALTEALGVPRQVRTSSQSKNHAAMEELGVCGRRAAAIYLCSILGIHRVASARTPSISTQIMLSIELDSSSTMSRIERNRIHPTPRPQITLCLRQTIPHPIHSKLTITMSIL